MLKIRKTLFEGAFWCLLEAGHTIEEAILILEGGQVGAWANADQVEAKLNREDWWDETNH